jgi:hypothetical protein
LKQQFCGLNGVCVAWISGFAATGGNWWDQTPSENWANFDNILNFMNVHLFNEISVRTTHEWRTGYENDDDKKVEVVYMYRSGDDPKAVGIIFNLNYNPSNMCDPDDWPFLTEGDLQQIDSRNLYYQNSSNPDRPNEFEENYFLQSDMGSFVVNLINTDSPFLHEMGLCDEYEITYYHPWNQSELATEHDNTSLVNDRLRIKNIPTLTVNMPFVLFTAHRTGSCVEGWFGMAGQESVVVDSTAFRGNNAWNEVTIVSAEPEHAAKCFVTPNLTNGLVHIYTSEQIIAVSIYDSRGNLINCQKLSNLDYDFSYLASGCYLMLVDTQHSRYNFKVIKL